MIDLVDCIWKRSFSLVILFAHLCKALRKRVLATGGSMAVSSSSPPPPSPAASSSSPSLPWKRFSDSPKPSIMKRSRESSAADWYPRENCARAVLRELGAKQEGGEEVVELGSSESRKARRRPARLLIPDLSAGNSAALGVVKEDAGDREFGVEGDGYFLASRRGCRAVMEDGYGVITNIDGDAKQAYFGVFDGHGGRAAVDFVSEKLGKNIVTALHEVGKKEGAPPALAIREGYLTTDRDFLTKNVGSGACVATVLLKDGVMHAANVGDCRVVLSIKGVAHALTRDHRAVRDDERSRIENTGGYVNCHNGVWRVQNSLSISRAIGDLHMKEWITSEPDIEKLRLTTDCDFLIIASDGLWDKVTDQEAVEVVMRHQSSIQSCKSLIGLSCSRGSRDDITVMVIDLLKFVPKAS